MLTKSELFTTVKKHCANKEEIVAVYLFGSLITDTFNQYSDLDLGIMVASRLDKATAFDLKLTSEVKLEKLVDREVDIVIFSQAPLRLKQQIIKGELIVENDKQLRVKEESRARDEYFDMKYFYNMYEEKLGKEIMDG